jgi:hypothetical protein
MLQRPDDEAPDRRIVFGYENVPHRYRASCQFTGPSSNDGATDVRCLR